MAPMGPGTYGSKKGRPATGVAKGAKAMKAATLALLKKKKKK